MHLLNQSFVKAFFIFLPFAFAFIITPIFENANKAFVAVVVTVFIYFLLNKDSLKNNFIENGKMVISPVIIGLTLYVITIYATHDISGREVRVLLCLSALSLFFPYQHVTKKMLRTAIILASAVIFLNSYYHNIHLGHSRWAGYMNPIPYANLSALVLILNFYFSIREQLWLNKAIHILASLLLVVVLVLTQVRGLWLAVPIAAAILLFKYFEKAPLKWKALFTLLIVASSLTIYPHIENRIERTIKELTLIEKGNLNSSIGLRLQMWKSSVEVAKKNPIIGVGRQYQGILLELYERGEVTEGLIKFNTPHFHNQYLDSLAKKGLIGLAFTLAIFISTLIMAKHCSHEEKQCLWAIVALFAVASLTDVPFYHAQTFLVYVLSVISIYTMGTQPNQGRDDEHSYS